MAEIDSLQTALAYARALFETAAEPMLVLDQDLRVEDANPAFYRTFRVGPEETLGSEVYALGDGQWDIPALRTLLSEIIPSDASFEDFHVSHTFEQIGHKEMYLNARRIEVDDRASLILLAIRDRTSEVEAREALRSHAAKLERSNTQWARFSSLLAHDLHEPIRTTKGFAELLLRRYEDQLDEQGRHYLERIEAGMARTASLIEGMRRLSKIETSSLEVTDVDLGQLAGEVLASLESRIEETGATVELGQLPTLPCDRSLIGQVLQNLVANAIKYHGEHPPQVHIRAEPLEGAWRILVHDQGPGIPEARQDSLFQLGHRVGEDPSIEGQGLGLALARTIIEHHGGTIGLRSAPGQGATFFFELPTARDAVLSATPAGAPGPSLTTVPDPEDG